MKVVQKASSQIKQNSNGRDTTQGPLNGKNKNGIVCTTQRAHDKIPRACGEDNTHNEDCEVHPSEKEKQMGKTNSNKNQTNQSNEAESKPDHDKRPSKQKPTWAPNAPRNIATRSVILLVYLGGRDFHISIPLRPYTLQRQQESRT